MLRIVLSLLSVSLCGLGFLLEDQKPTVDHDLIRYLDTVVTTLVNLTTKLEKDIAIKNDLTQFLQSDLQQINGSLQAETQKRQTLENKVIQLERRLVLLFIRNIRTDRSDKTMWTLIRRRVLRRLTRVHIVLSDL